MQKLKSISGIYLLYIIIIGFPVESKNNEPSISTLNTLDFQGQMTPRDPIINPKIDAIVSCLNRVKM